MVETIVLGINRFGEEVYDWLCERDDADILALVTESSQFETIRRLEPDLLVSAGFRHIVPEEILEIPSLGAVNLHPSYLPYNRGANPNVWSIIEGTPAGVSIHYMTPEIDAGPLIARRKVEKRPDDTGRTLYRRLERAQIDLFKERWAEIRDGSVETVAQPGEGTYHYKQEFVDLFEINDDETIQVGEMIDRLRALTFPPYNNAFVERDGEKYYLELTITAEEDIEPGSSIHWNLPKYGEKE